MNQPIHNESSVSVEKETETLNTMIDLYYFNNKHCNSPFKMC